VRAHGGSPSWDQRRLRTSSSGQFRIALPGNAEAWDVRAAFTGDRQHAGVRAERRVDVAIADVALHLGLASARLDLDETAHPVIIRASSAAGVDGLRITVEDELGRPLTSGEMSREGVLHLQVLSADLGAAGPGRIRAASQPDSRRSPSRTEISIVRFRQPQLTLEPTEERYLTSDAIDVRGRLSDSAGGLGDRAVALLVDGDLSRTVLTDADGDFVAELRIDQPGDLRLVARFESDSPGRPSVGSDWVLLHVVSGPRFGGALILVAILISIIIAIVLRRRSGMILQVPANEAAPVPTVRKGELTARTASLFGVDGSVRNCHTEAPVVGATLTLRRGETTVETASSDAKGAFSFGELDRGPLVLEVNRRGYRSFGVRVTIPHRGEWSRAQVRLESLRQIALAPLRRLARRLLARERTWGIWTNREIASERIEALLGVDEAAALVRRVDDAYYGEDEPNEADIREIEGMAETETTTDDQLD